MSQAEQFTRKYGPDVGKHILKLDKKVAAHAKWKAHWKEKAEKLREEVKKLREQVKRLGQTPRG